MQSTNNYTQLASTWRNKAKQSRKEAARIRSAVGCITDAEDNCILRAEMWEQCAHELELIDGK